jgi:hypothetical protein
MNFDPQTGEPLKPGLARPPMYPPPQKGGRSPAKIIIPGVLVGGLLLVAGCAVVVALGTSSAVHRASVQEAKSTARAARFRSKLKLVKVGDPITGEGGSTVNQVLALLGRPHYGDTTVTHSGGATLMTYSYHFPEATGSPSWIVSFTNGHVTSKTSM